LSEADRQEAYPVPLMAQYPVRGLLSETLCMTLEAPLTALLRAAMRDHAEPKNGPSAIGP
jgi:hypothetical protein